jgi:hypothetical protein
MPTTLHQQLAGLVNAWRDAGYPCPQFPSVGEILDFARRTDTGHPRLLRRPQVRALETYWYLRLVQGTPRVIDLYKSVYARPLERLTALGLDHPEIKDWLLNAGDPSLGFDQLLAKVKADDDFVREYRLEGLRESLTLDYPSYILALAMGAGKTMLIGSILATEFAMATEYPDGPFVQNALVFAPGLTIIESLRELVSMPYHQVLPPHLHKLFSASVKITFTRPGEKDVPIVRGSLFNVVVTNTERIRIQKETIRKGDLGGLFDAGRLDEAMAEVANLRLQAIASLPHLAVFSDEAHHTYGQSLDKGLKKVRKTVDYLAQQTNLVCVVNTTGTPYYQRQPLKDVVVWYGLSEGVRDNILKDPSGNIQAYDFAGDAKKYVGEVVRDFFRDYADVRLPSGAPARLAMYFPQTDDLKELRPAVDRALIEAGQSPAVCLVNTSDETLTKAADIAAFNRLNDPNSPHRVILLVNKGTEGWNCPSLFACALARTLRSSNNFVLQAATRCLRQVPGNTVKARIYLSADNYTTLDNQLQETYGETLSQLNRSSQETRTARVVLRKRDLPPMVVNQAVRTVVRGEAQRKPLRLVAPTGRPAAGLTVRKFRLAHQHSTASILEQDGEAVALDEEQNLIDPYSCATELSARCRTDWWAVYDELRRLYDGGVPAEHVDALSEQIERQNNPYEVREETVEVALALVRPDGFKRETDADGNEVFTTEIVYRKDREHLLLSWNQMRDKDSGDFSFHLDPYSFDSNPEKSFFEQILGHLNVRASEVEDFLFTGSLTDRNKTDFFVEYRDEQGKWRTYTPDFVLRKKPRKGRRRGTGRVFLIEIKREADRDHPIDGANGRKAMAVRQWERINPDGLRYEIIFTPADTVAPDRAAVVRIFSQESENE